MYWSAGPGRWLSGPPSVFNYSACLWTNVDLCCIFIWGLSKYPWLQRPEQARSVLKGSHAAVCRKMINLFLNDSCLDRPDVASIFVRFPPELMDRKCASLTFSGQTDLSLSIQAIVILKYALGKEKQGGWLWSRQSRQSITSPCRCRTQMIIKNNVVKKRITVCELCMSTGMNQM